MATASAAGLALRRHGLPFVSLFNDPVAAGTSRPEGNPPDDLHFAEGNYAQNSALEEPHLERWVTGYSDDSGTPQESTYVSGSVYEYAPESYYEEEDYYYGEEE